MDIPTMPVARPLLLPARKRQNVRRRKSLKTLKLRYLCVIVACLFSNCATTPPRNTAPIPRPAESKPVAPLVKKANQQLTVTRETLDDLRGGLDQAVSEADRLRRQKTANEAELNRMWAILTKEKERAAQLWQSLQDSLRTVAELEAAALERDLEIDALRKNNDVLNTRLDDAQKWIEHAKPKVAVYDWWAEKFQWVMNRIYWLIGFAIVGMILYVVIRYWPAIAARFVKPI